jgi:hypothetical protein
MATRSTIAKLNPDGSLTSVYCHWDGYPDGVGATLRQHYTNPSKIDQLLALGDLSVLDAEIGDSNDFENRVEGICLFYGRDRAETDVAACTHVSIEAWLVFRSDCEYAYLWNDGREEWETFKGYGV